MLRETTIENGKVKGFPGTDARITVYKGIPYAAPPVGENRWRAPQPVENWEGVRECYEFAPINMQRTPGEDPEAFYSKEWHVDPNVPMSEDSLYLNIWTPAKSKDEKLPVMVWIFGGGFQEGYSYEQEFDGERIASRGVILVSIAYRLNVFGFLAHPELTAQDPENPTNYGLLDQLAAIKWVGRNIEAFGGDPKNITIFGQSAGGDGVYAHLCSPKANGAFQRAIVESNGGFTYRFPDTFLTRTRLTLPEAEQKGINFLKDYLGVETIEEARKLDAKFIEEKQLEARLGAVPVVDKKYLMDDMPKTVMKNEMNDIPFMIGNTLDEFMFGPSEDGEEAVLAWSKENFGDRGEEYFDIIKRQAEKTGETLKKTATVCSFELGAQLALEYMAEYGINPYYYRFGPTIPGDDAGAFHSCDLWFEFETLMKCWRPFDGHHYDVSRKMCNYWTNFAKYGDPNGLDADGKPMPKWEKFTKDNKTAMCFFDEVFASDEITEKRAFLLDINLKDVRK